jgi:hypothetical protein
LPEFSPTRITFTNSGEKMSGCLAIDPARSRPALRLSMTSCRAVTIAGLRAESARPRSARTIGMPALVSAYIWRANIIRSARPGFGVNSLNCRACAPTPSAWIGSMRTGVTPEWISCAAAAELLSAWSSPLTRRPPRSRPRNLNVAMRQPAAAVRT